LLGIARGVAAISATPLACGNNELTGQLPDLRIPDWYPGLADDDMICPEQLVA